MDINRGPYFRKELFDGRVKFIFLSKLYNSKRTLGSLDFIEIKKILVNLKYTSECNMRREQDIMRYLFDRGNFETILHSKDTRQDKAKIVGFMICNDRDVLNYQTDVLKSEKRTFEAKFINKKAFDQFSGDAQKELIKILEYISRFGYFKPIHCRVDCFLNELYNDKKHTGKKRKREKEVPRRFDRRRIEKKRKL